MAALGAAATAPLGARVAPAQQSDEIRRIGVLVSFAASDAGGQARIAAFRDGLQALGWKEASNINITTRWASAGPASIQQAAKELALLPLDLVLSHNTPTTTGLLQHTRTIPIVFASVSDPVGSGFVASFARPGGNATGFTDIDPAMAGKSVELLKEIAPHVARAAFLFNPGTAPYAEYYLGSFKAAAASFGVEASAARVRAASELEPIFAAYAVPDGGIVVMSNSFMVNHREAIVTLATAYHVPTVYPYRFFADIGGLVSYGNDLIDGFRRAAIYADRILKGAKPSDLPVQAPVKFDLVINLKTAKARPYDPAHPPRPRRRGDRMSNCVGG